MPAEIQVGLRVRPPYAGRDLPQAGERLRGVGAERRHGHHPAQVEVRRVPPPRRPAPAHVRRPHPAAAGSRRRG